MSVQLFGKFILPAFLATASTGLAQDNVMVVFDGSNSMWGQIDGTAKIDIARGVIDQLLGDWVDTRQVGLMAYGHRTRGDCGDIEVLVEPGAQSRAAILDRINSITPTGKTPLTDAVRQAARSLSYTDQPATVVLISDGLESCNQNACAMAQELERSGVDFTAHVVGFGLGSDEDTSSLACIAEETGGKYITAGNAKELGSALSAVGSAVAEAVVVEEPEPEPEPEPEAPKVAVTGPDTAVGGTVIDVTWTPTIAEADYINIVPVGTDPDVFGSYVRIGKSSEVSPVVPGEEGLYEIRYLHNQSKEVLGSATIEITKPSVNLTGEDKIETGAEFVVSWDPTINRRDYVSIVPMGADEGTFGNYVNVSDNSSAKLRAPADPGLYELRYLLNVDKRTVASVPIEVIAPQVALTAPSSVLTGANFDVAWTGAVNSQDYVTIVPTGSDEGVYGNYIVVRDVAMSTLKAPAETGLYEVRYILREGNKTLASVSIEVTAPEVTISGPETITTGQKFDVTWTGAVHVQDYVSIVPAGSDEGVYGNYDVVRDRNETTLTAPADPGVYELRYILREGAKTLASTMIEVTPPEVALVVPETVLAGSKFKVSWTGAVSGQDYINIVPTGTDEGQFGNYLTVRDNLSDELQAPSDPGMYEIRYVLREGAKTIATASVEVTDPEVTINATVEVRAGEKLRISWTGAVSARDYVTLVPFGAPDNELGVYAQVRDNSEQDVEAPEETGLYEVRYVLREGTRVVARQTVEVLAADAQLDSGATIEAPDTGAPGSTISVSWQVDSDGADQRITVARADQAMFTWLSAYKITGAPPIDLKLPDAPGAYEIRFLDLSNKAILSRKVIKVE